MLAQVRLAGERQPRQVVERRDVFGRADARSAQALRDRRPPRPRRSEAEQSAADTLKTHLRDARIAFLRRHAAALYAQLTEDRSRFVRVEELVFRAAEAVPGLVPTRDQIRAERT